MIYSSTCLQIAKRSWKSSARIATNLAKILTGSFLPLHQPAWYYRDGLESHLPVDDIRVTGMIQHAHRRI
jgi:hypothetical protein